MAIVIYSKPNCVFCDKAKAMVKNLNLEYEEKMFGKDFNSVEELYEAVGKQVRTMPQILIDGKLIGGYNQLVEHFTDKGLVNFKGEKVKWQMTMLSYFQQIRLRIKKIQVSKTQSFLNELRKNRPISLLNLL